MKKIITLYQRNYDGDRRVRDEVVPGAEWVLDGEGVATIKWDGTCCKVEGGQLFKRYDAKKGKTPPSTFVPAQPEADPETGHWPGWLPVGDGPEDRWHREAWDALGGDLADGTYELLGPNVQGNPEGQSAHVLVPHGDHHMPTVPRTYDELRAWLASRNYEGIVWWRDPSDPDCDKVKLKAKDFGYKRAK